MSLQQIRDIVQEMELNGSNSSLRKKRRRLMERLKDPMPVHSGPPGTLTQSEKEFRQAMKVTKQILKDFEEDDANG